MVLTHEHTSHFFHQVFRNGLLQKLLLGLVLGVDQRVLGEVDLQQTRVGGDLRQRPHDAQTDTVGAHFASFPVAMFGAGQPEHGSRVDLALVVVVAVLRLLIVVVFDMARIATAAAGSSDEVTRSNQRHRKRRIPITTAHFSRGVFVFVGLPRTCDCSSKDTH